MEDGVQSDRQPATIVVSVRTVLGFIAVALLIGVVLGRTFASDGGARAAALQTEASPAATTESETDELNRLRTQVAQTPVCVLPSPTPEPSPTATPTPVPPVAIGTPVDVADDWTVTVNAIVQPPTIGIEPTGKFIQLNVTVVNNTADGRTYPFRSWQLVDDQGRVFGVTGDATTVVTGSGWYRSVDPYLPADFEILFDVAVDAGPNFILESKSDPTLRVGMQLQLLG